MESTGDAKRAREGGSEHEEERRQAQKRVALADPPAPSQLLSTTHGGTRPSDPALASSAGATDASLPPPAPPSQWLRCFVRKEDYLTYHPLKKAHCVHFCKFVEKFSDAEVGGFFRDLMADLASRGVQDFHLQIVGSARSGPQGFFVEVHFGQKHDGPPDIPMEECIACQPEAEIFPGMTSQETYLPEYDSLHMKVSLDAQARPAYIITPLRHCESLSQLEDTEVVDLWRTTAKVVKMEKLFFTRMVLNHGTYRNLPHLHLKLFTDKMAFEKSRDSWAPERKAVWQKMLDLKPEKSNSICKFFKVHGHCRYGNGCKNQHVAADGDT